MSRYVRNTGIQFKLETTYGTDPGGYTSTDFALIRDASFRIDRDTVPRQLIRGYMGASEELVGSRRAEINFTVELAGSGTAGSTPQYGPLLRACGMSQAVTAGVKVEYTPVSKSFSSVTLRYFSDGAVHTARGCRGTVKIGMTAYGIPTLAFSFKGYDSTTSSTSLDPSDFNSWRRPLVVTDANSSDIRLDSSYNATTGAITSGTILQSQGIEIDLGHQVEHIKLLGGEAIEITGREVTGSTTLFLLGTDEAAWRTDINNNVLSAMSFSHGTTAGGIVKVFMPNVQRVNPQMGDMQGRVVTSVDLRALPSTSAGNDELRLVIM